jgi:CrcB protein
MNEPATVWAAIAAGSALGGVLRHAATLAVTAAAGSVLPWGTLAVNVSGSAAMGVVAALMTHGIPSAWPALLRHGLATGLLGGFTTFSAFSLQTVALLSEGRILAAVVNAILSVGLCVLACGVGYFATTTLGR